jgi:hypothetical protein
MKKDGTVSYRGAVYCRTSYPRWPRLICSAQVESEKMDDVAFILDDHNCGAACRFHWQFAFSAQNASDRKE